MKTRIKIQPVNAQLLKDQDLLGKMDPAVKLTIGSQTYTTSAAKAMGMNPIWNEKFCFEIQPNDILKIEVFDDDFGFKDNIGKAEVNLSEIPLGQTFDRLFPLKSRIRRKEVGQIHLRFEPDLSEMKPRFQPSEHLKPDVMSGADSLAMNKYEKKPSPYISPVL